LLRRTRSGFRELMKREKKEGRGCVEFLRTVRSLPHTRKEVRLVIPIRPDQCGSLGRGGEKRRREKGDGQRTGRVLSVLSSSFMLAIEKKKKRED